MSETVPAFEFEIGETVWFAGLYVKAINSVVRSRFVARDGTLRYNLLSVAGNVRQLDESELSRLPASGAT